MKIRTIDATEEKESTKAIPQFDEAILNPQGDEIVCAVRTIPLHEFKLDEYCRKEGLVTYLPLQRVLRFHNVTSKGRPYTYSKEVLRPLFPSYLFLKATMPTLRGLFESKMLQRYLPPSDQESFLNEIRVVRKCEIVGFSQELEVHGDILEGKRFLITSGIWEGVEGRLTKKNDLCKWTVEIEFCQQYITVELDPTQYKMIPLDV